MEVRKDMKDWVLSLDGDKWSVTFDVRDLGRHFDTTFRGWSATLAAKVRLVISLLVLMFALPLDFHGRVRGMGLRPLCLLLLAYESFGHLFVVLFGLVVSLWLVLVLFLACLMGPLVVALLFAWFGSVFVYFVGI